jgi:hypothetical protein
MRFLRLLESYNARRGDVLILKNPSDELKLTLKKVKYDNILFHALPKLFSERNDIDSKMHWKLNAKLFIESGILNLYLAFRGDYVHKEARGFLM